MKKWKKITIGVVLLLVLVGIVTASVQISGKDVVTVQTGKTLKQDLSQVVTASGEIKPLNYVNVSAMAYGRITEIDVKEGDRVRKGQILAKLESVQPKSDLEAQQAQTQSAEMGARSAEAGVASAEANYNTAKADEIRGKAQLEQARLDLERAKGLFKDELIAKADFDAKQASYDVAVASNEQSKARTQQAKAQWDQSKQQLAQVQASFKQNEKATDAFKDRLDKTIFAAPLDGMVSNLPVHAGEYMVVGIQNNPGSLLMTIADMSVVTAEVRVDETDIVSISMGQPAEVRIDAMPDKVFTAKVTEIGNTAIIRSTGLATSQSTTGSQEAKDFKVVVTLDNPPDTLRPGLSCTTKITTSAKKNVLTIPIQALTIRQKGDLDEQNKKAAGNGSTTHAAAPQAAESEQAKKEDKKELQGVFVIRGEKAEFVEVTTGITGTTDIEVTKGLQDADQIVTGSYRVLRTLKNHAKIKIDNKAPKVEEKTS
jgi:HlyD family secretion protein